MKKSISLFYLLLISFLGFAQFMKTDTISDLKDYSILIEKSYELLDLIKSENIKEVENNISSKWGNKKLFKSLIREVSDSLQKYGIPAQNKVIAMKDFMTIEGTTEQFEILRLKFLLNTDTFVEEKSYSITITFIFTEYLVSEKIYNFQVEIPFVMDEIMKEFNK